MELAPGRRIGHLTVEHELGRGAFGVVWLARDELIDRPVALKVIPGGEAAGGAREEILSEARIVAGLESPHVVTLYSLREAPDGLWVQEMEYVGGGSLEERLEGGDLPDATETRRILSGIAAALAAADAARIVHADVKPANVLFDTDGTVKLADFGVARILEGSRTSHLLEGRVLGSPLYMAPEVISGREASPASDVWSAGVVLQRLLSGGLPFPAETLSELIPKILTGNPETLPADAPADLADLCRACLARNPSERPSAAAIVERLSAANAPERTLVTRATGPVGTFLDREWELGELRDLLLARGTSLVTLVGPPGVGKSRLGREAARTLANRFPGGAILLDGSGATNAADLTAALEAEIGGPLCHRPATLVALDGIDAIGPEAAVAISEWRRDAPAAMFLAISESLLQLAGERHVALAPLGPDAARLLSDRLAEAGMEEPPDAGTVRAVLLEADGFPLAIEEAAGAIAGGSSPTEFPELRRRILSAIARLSAAERDAFLAAARFEAPFNLDEAEAAIDLSSHLDAPFLMDVFQVLEDRSLIHVESTGEESLFSLYRPLRRFALDAGGDGARTAV